jgi:hypothetical protein
MECASSFPEPFRRVLVSGASLRDVAVDLLILLAWLAGGWSIAGKTFRWE